ncbi:MAG: hypothetical protein A2509_10615 [Candidatus Edwardsbacteria bacterium RIFOXYD12_FULL_50_11]|uniref:Glycosyl transferase family 1 n=1 Tax=Candidatus Edwardsbacteria bacterium GWF2_54_11 TaxID=1817851 RepID=A0A1F5RGX8_9BACT|nr:MAG: hypothetical protein A2502_09320 [Candidatus Edwardsbacteria bacterium RifOxyC12_full_54_24]OGF07218.1 MAG: hypothetical protein A2273_01735 [Candidatus Edwardsbacteria bacterium RifOxyA12_full_54_48]OGF09473.1 MAG: hypothetical protein A3K15_08145 [Candidatus Edwardsbacteria bacterium GWE2_54_12]OGF13403.1 MAG: hypothetical protein A2024_05310 [Candidatus Edwardsbacteria bacterium GWF2_54_11]OGF17261.1 MAG: hypothetical protein A2509_10615 [Candidatus Edwardsbacteria bacterium RIFOXYD1
MNIIFITPHGNLIYGGEKSLLLLMRELRQRNVRVTVVCPETGVFINLLKAEGIETVVCPICNLFKRTVFIYLNSVLRLWVIVRKVKPDIIHCNSATVAQIAIPVAWLFGIPTVVHLRNDLSCSGAKRDLVTKALAVIANSSFTGADLINCMDQEKRHVIHNPIEIPAVDALGQDTDRRLVLFVGQICPHKGVDAFIQIASKLKNHPLKPRLMILGDEPYHAKGYLHEIKKKAEELGVLPIIEFAGHVKEPEKYYQKASVVIVPSKKEPFGRVAAEAMMYGLPVVASRVGGLPEVVEDNVTGFLVDPDDVDGFTEKVQYLLNEPEKAKAMGRAGRERAIKLFSPQRHAAQVMEVYKEVLK